MNDTMSVLIEQLPMDVAEVRFSYCGDEIVLHCTKDTCMFVAAWLLMGAGDICRGMISNSAKAI